MFNRDLLWKGGEIKKPAHGRTAKEERLHCISCVSCSLTVHKPLSIPALAFPESFNRHQLLQGDGESHGPGEENAWSISSHAIVDLKVILVHKLRS